jgi:hypothetical protein
MTLAAEAAGWLAVGEAVTVDVRSPDWFRAEHIAAAVSVLGPLTRG